MSGGSVEQGTVAAVGDVLAGKYRVEKILGIGGMGMVVAAIHLELEQRVALKFMLPDAMRAKQAQERFLREAKAAVRLRSQHVCRVLDVGKLDSGAPYIVMEFLEGQDLAQLIESRGALPVVEALDYVLQAVEGVAEAHSHGIVHRDLKPANLFVTRDNDGTPLVKVLDFGISKSATSGATRTGEIMGSPSYMAPEQMASSKHVDARADVWALGVILYQATTGALPFSGESLPALCMQVMHAQPPPPSQIRSGLPDGFDAVLMRCLDKRPDSRYRNVAELAAAVMPFARPEARSTATRVANVLNRGAVPAQDRASPHRDLPPTQLSVPAAEDGHSDESGRLGPRALAAAGGVRGGEVSTLQSSAGSLGVHAVPRRTGILRAIAWGALTAVVVAAALTITLRRGASTGDADKAPTKVAPATASGSTATDPEAPSHQPVQLAADAGAERAPVIESKPSIPSPPDAGPTPSTELAHGNNPAPRPPSTKNKSTSKTAGNDRARTAPSSPSSGAPAALPAATTPSIPSTSPPAPAAKAPTSPDDVWTHMQHDKTR